MDVGTKPSKRDKFFAKAEEFFNKHQAQHMASSGSVKNEKGHASGGYKDYLKKAQELMNKNDKKEGDKKDGDKKEGDEKEGDQGGEVGQNKEQTGASGKKGGIRKEHLALGAAGYALWRKKKAMKKKKKKKKRFGGGGEEEEEEEEEGGSSEESEEEEEEEKEGGKFDQFVTWIQEVFEE